MKIIFLSILVIEITNNIIDQESIIRKIRISNDILYSKSASFQGLGTYLGLLINFNSLMVFPTNCVKSNSQLKTSLFTASSKIY